MRISDNQKLMMLRTLFKSLCLTFFICSEYSFAAAFNGSAREMPRAVEAQRLASYEQMGPGELREEFFLVKKDLAVEKEQYYSECAELCPYVSRRKIPWLVGFVCIGLADRFCTSYEERMVCSLLPIAGHKAIQWFQRCNEPTALVQKRRQAETRLRLLRGHLEEKEKQD